MTVRKSEDCPSILNYSLLSVKQLTFKQLKSGCTPRASNLHNKPACHTLSNALLIDILEEKKLKDARNEEITSRHAAYSR